MLISFTLNFINCEKNLKNIKNFDSYFFFYIKLKVRVNEIIKFYYKFFLYKNLEDESKKN